MIHRRDMFLGFILLFAVGLVMMLAFLLLSSKGGDGVSVSGESVALIEVIGPILSPMSIVQKLERYIKDENIPAIVIRLNTPGGGVSATQEIYETVLKARFAGKIVVASMGSVAASGGYYIAAACDSVMATSGTITGSIGVIAKFSEYSELFDKLGITFNVRKSGKFKDTGSPARKMTDEEAALIDSVVMDTYDQFVEAVAEGRGLDRDHVLKYADGRVFTGRQAQELGFVDLLGTYQDAIDLAGDMAGLGVNPPVVKDPKSMFWDFLLDGVTNIVVRGIEKAAPRISYQWQ